MSLTSGTRLGMYEIQSALGAGGMGEVYRAVDTKLGREVAIKILPEAFARDAERLARFEREARVLASLNHPLIATIHGLEEANGRAFLVMELVDGPTLADLLDATVSGQSPRRTAPSEGEARPVADSLSIARQIAEALEAAHERGIIHRDLKPANVKVRPDGVVKLLDFGLAKIWEPGGAAEAGAGRDLTHSPTLTNAASMPGMILGTAAYMSPEQAKGQPVDRRTDIFAFGCVLFELLTGRPAFHGDSVSTILARVIEREPDWSLLPAGLPPRIRELLQRCLEKDSRRRQRDAGDVRLEIEHALTGPTHPIESAAPLAPGRGARAAWIVAGVLAVALAAAVAGPYFRATVNPPEMRLEISTPPTSDPTSFALSPDGRMLAFVATESGQPRLFLRSLDADSAKPLAGTEGAAYPFWSPDSRSLGFFGGNARLNRLDIADGTVQPLASSQPGVGGTWAPDGTILFANLGNGPLFRVPATGGEAVPVTKLATPRETSHRLPAFLPDGRHFLFYVQGTDDVRGIHLGSLDYPRTVRLAVSDTAGVYSNGRLLFANQGRLVSRPFDPAEEELRGDPSTVAESVTLNTVASIGGFSASTTGLLAYRRGGITTTQLTWLDRSGRPLGTLGPPEQTDLANPALSPDGTRVAVSRTVQGNTDIWLLDGVRTTRLTSGTSSEQFPIWSPDGSQIAFDSTRKGGRHIYQMPARGEERDDLLLELPELTIPSDWSPDGRSLMYFRVDPKTSTDLWLLPLAGDRKPIPFLNTATAEVWGQFSPDGRFVAYQSSESGRWEIFVRPFQGAGGPSPVSGSGGVYPRWSPDGKELYFIAPDGDLMGAPITAKAGTLDVGTPIALFHTRILGGGANMIGRNHQYDVAPDGRILMNVVAGEGDTAPITIVLNWTPR